MWIEESGHAVLVNQERHRQGIGDFYEILNRRSGLQVEDQWLMKDGSYYGAHTLSISCTKSVISCKASIFFSHARLQGSIFSPYCDSF